MRIAGNIGKGELLELYNRPGTLLVEIKLRNLRWAEHKIKMAKEADEK